ncbi:MAG TPA: triose-phosphate isomerase [Alphaproteobacteria bacterium]|nr:triose-phosphate isomerase [Alphaproteobacteria bacterium]
MKNLIAGNWKMNGTLKTAIDLATGIVDAIQQDHRLLTKNDFLVCPPYHHLVPVQAELTVAVSLGAQDCSPFDNGAYTGDISAEMLKDVNCTYVILGHSERRQYYLESNLMIQKKAEVANDQGLISIICVGETEDQREAGEEKAVVEKQLLESLPETATAENTVIAYEPVWAIGTGKTATTDDIAAMHDFIRTKLAERLENAEKVRILYGGSVKPANAAEIFAVGNVNGALIGGASLKAEDFIGIAKAS